MPMRAYRMPGAVRGALSDYRAAREDIAQDDQDRHTGINCPTLALWGEDFELVGRMVDLLSLLFVRQVTASWDCNHLQYGRHLSPDCFYMPNRLSISASNVIAGIQPPDPAGYDPR